MIDKNELLKSGKLIQDCDKCGKRKPIWTNEGSNYLCRGCAVSDKATDAGLDAMRE